jgi:heptose I phosphotransferase
MSQVKLVSATLREVWPEAKVFEQITQLQGEVFRALENRRTLRFELGEQAFFLKYHRGITIAECLKNFITLRMPIFGATNEFMALEKLAGLGLKVPVVAAFGRRGWLPWTVESFLVTEALDAHVSLEDVCARWRESPPQAVIKWALIREVARISRIMHGAGVCHRDYYLCHFLLNPHNQSLVLIDLHRALIKPRLRQRWRVKDIGGLYFSALESGLKQRDLLRFMKEYSQSGLRRELQENQAFWAKVKRRAINTYRADFNRDPAQ